MRATEIVARAESGWPYDAVPYSQSGIFNDDDGSGPHIGGYRRDCSGFATMAGGGPTPGYSTVTMLTSGWVTPISWDQLAPGDFVGRLGIGTAGDAGHVMAVVAVDHAAGTYTVLEQAGYGPGPDRNTYQLRDGQDRAYLPYRLTNLEDDMLSAIDIENIVLLITRGYSHDGYPDPKGNLGFHLTGHSLGSVEQRLAAQVADGFASLAKAIAAAGGITPDGLAKLLEQVSAAAERGAEQGAADALDGATLTIHTEAGQ